MRGRRIRAVAAAALAACLTAACQPAPEDIPAQAAQEDYSGISDKARSHLPEDTDLANVLKDNTGCYAVYDEGDKWVRPLLDDQEEQVCD